MKNGSEGNIHMTRETRDDFNSTDRHERGLNEIVASTNITLASESTVLSDDREKKKVTPCRRMHFLSELRKKEEARISRKEKIKMEKKTKENFHKKRKDYLQELYNSKREQCENSAVKTVSKIHQKRDPYEIPFIKKKDEESVGIDHSMRKKYITEKFGCKKHGG